LISFTDTHCHLTLPQFDIDRFEVITKAIKLGLNKVLIPGIDLQSSEEAIKLCAIYPGKLFAAIGIHPNSKIDFSVESKNMLLALSKVNQVVAIGEIGLDYYRMSNPIDQQKDIFKMQLELASEINLPVCIHNRDATDDVIRITEEWLLIHKNDGNNLPIKGVFHSFNGNLDSAKQIISLGYFLGISGPITFPKNHEFEQVIQEAGIANLVVETDSPYLAPQPARGKRNLPEYVLYVIEKLSQIFQLPIEDVCRITNENAARLFQWTEKQEEPKFLGSS
jgi:TatD DNase family protein